MKPLIIFDLDGTLYTFDNSDSVNFTSSRFYKAIKEKAYAFISAKLGVDSTEAQQTYERIKEEFDGEISLGLEARFGIDRYEYFGNTWDLEPTKFIGQKKDLSLLIASLNAEVAVLTAAPRIWASKALDYLGLSEYRGRLFTGEPDIRKPNPLAFKNVCDALDVPTKKSISVGDQVHSDILPAKSVGMRTILVRSQSDEADYCINDLEELPEIVRG